MNYIVYLLFSAFGIIFALDTSHGTITRMADSVRGPVVDSMERFLQPRDPVEIVTRPGMKAYRGGYRKLPENFQRAAGILFYRAGGKRSTRAVAGDIMELTDFYTLTQCADAVEKANGLKNGRVENGDIIAVPGTLPLLIPDPAAGRNRNRFTARGLYFSGSSAGASGFPELLDTLKQYGINTVVFDIKDVTGIVNYKSALPAVIGYGTHDKRTIHNIGKLLRLLRQKRIRSVARVAVFQDRLLAKREPSLAIRSARSGGVWNAESSEIWLDPTSRKVQQYVLDITGELLELGVDEIQYDYIRFPTTGNLKDARFAYDFGPMDHKSTITAFLGRAHRMIKAADAVLSIDIFGVVAWGKECDIRTTGQDIGLLARHCDVISPMLYPSHFNDDFDGFSRPGDNPYYFINEGCKRVMALSGGSITVRPWLQAFRWRVSNYDAAYIRRQIEGSDDCGASGYLFWNASNDYRVVYRALGKKNDQAQR